MDVKKRERTRKYKTEEERNLAHLEQMRKYNNANRNKINEQNRLNYLHRKECIMAYNALTKA